MKILATTELTVTKTIYTADWIDGYSDESPLSSTTMEYESEEARLAGLTEYDKTEIDIDITRHQYGWQFGHKTVLFHVMTEVVENDDGTIIVRQKE